MSLSDEIGIMPADSKKNNAVICVIYGDDRRQALDQLDQLIEQYLPDADRQMCLNQYEGDSAELASVLDDVRTLPFLAKRRMVIVKQADAFITKYRQELEEYVEHPCSTGILVLMPEKFPSNTRLAKKAAQIGQVFACEKVSGRDLPAFLIDYAKKRHRLTLAPDACASLIELAGEDSGLLTAELDKVATFLADNRDHPGRILPQDIQSLVGNNRQFNVFHVIDAMTAGDVAASLARLHQMLQQDRSAEFTAVGAFAWHFRRLYNARILLEQKIPDRDILKEVRIWAQQDLFLRQVRRLTLPQAGNIIKSLMEIDLASKSGGPSAGAALERLIVQYCQAVRKAG